MAKFKTIITTAGAAKIAAVLAGTASIVLDNTAKMAVGDGGGTLPVPNPAQTKLVNEVYRAPINRASIDTSNPKNIVVELVIPPEKPDTSGFWVREMALYDAAGTLLAVGNMAETYKPSLSEGAGRKMVIRMVIAVSEVNAITITMDTSTVMATQDYVDSEIDKHAKSRNHPDATLTAKGFTQLNSATNSTLETQAATPKAVKTVMDATNLKAPLASPALTGKPTAPTAAQTASDTQIATTAFVKAAIDALINSSPGALDTLGELAAALGNDPNFATTMVNALAAKAPLASPTLTGTPTAPTAAQSVSSTQIATTAFVKAAIDALVNSSPGALDTLSELAAALGNDPNFATTMVNALAAKAPLASPSLTGKPTAPTAAQTSNDTQLATTEFVTRAVAPAFMVRGALPTAANLNSYGPVPDFIGIWSRSTGNNTTAAYNFPEDGGQGILEVIPGGLQGVTQRYTTGSGNVYVRPLTAVWNGTDGPWGAWQLAGVNTRPGFYSGDLNSLVLPGTWATTNTVTNGPTISGSTTVSTGICEVILRNASNTVLQRFTNMTSGATTYNFTWQRTLYGTTWSAWELLGTKALNNLGLGLPTISFMGSFDWQQADYLTGAIYLVSSTNVTNMPVGITYPSATPLFISVKGLRGDRAVIEITPDTPTASTYKQFEVLSTGAKGARTFVSRQIYTSADIVPIENGGTGATAPETARANLGFDAMGIGAPVAMLSALDWQTFSFLPGAQYACTPANQANIPAGLNFVASGTPTSINVLGGRVVSGEAPLILLITQYSTGATAKSYLAVMSGSKGSRTFTVYENFTSASIIPFANGGTGGKTVDEARGNLGVNRLVQGKDDTYITSQSDNYRLFVNDQGGWGVLNNIGTPQALALDKGGTGATDAAAARTNLGLGNSATRNVGTVANTVAAGNDSRIVNAVQKAEFTSGNGWAKFPDGTIIQTGVAQAGYLGFPSDVTYPIPFTVGGPTIVANFDSAVANANDCPAFSTTPLTNSSFRLMSSRVNTGSIPYARWIAIGK